MQTVCYVLVGYIGPIFSEFHEAIIKAKIGYDKFCIFLLFVFPIATKIGFSLTFLLF